MLESGSEDQEFNFRNVNHEMSIKSVEKLDRFGYMILQRREAVWMKLW